MIQIVRLKIETMTSYKFLLVYRCYWGNLLCIFFFFFELKKYLCHHVQNWILDMIYLEFTIHIFHNNDILHFVCSYRSSLLCEMDQRLKKLRPESSGSNAGAVALRRSLPWQSSRTTCVMWGRFSFETDDKIPHGSVFQRNKGFNASDVSFGRICRYCKLLSTKLVPLIFYCIL